jgi:signal peptidase II
LIWNEGIAFGLFSFSKTIMYDLLTLFISLVILVIFIMLIKSKDLGKYPLLMIFGGAIGNLYDRVFYKAVPDFIDLHVNNFHWFIFNVADIFITVGVIFMILIEIIANKKKHE